MAKKGKTNFANQIEPTEVRFEKWRKYQQFLLVVCEDQNTEPSYIKTFKNSFPEHTLFLEVAGVGKDPLGVVLAAIEQRNRLSGLTKRKIDEVWVIFDKDDADFNQARIDRFNNAFAIANENAFKIAWSNEVFELWFLLHFVDVDPAVPLSRSTVYDNLKSSINVRLGTEVISDGHSNPEIIPYLSSHGSETDAINRAASLLSYHAAETPIKANPATQMHMLVKSLRDWIAYYQYDN